MRRRQTMLTALALAVLLTSGARATQASRQAPAQDPKPAPEITAATATDAATAPQPRAMAITGRYFQEGLSLSVRTPGGAVVEYKCPAIGARPDTSCDI